MWAQASDAELVMASQAGDTNAFEMIVSRHQQRVYGVALARLSPGLRDIEDVAQETFVDAWNALARSGAAPRDLAPWLCGIARNKAAKVIADRSRELLTFDPESLDLLDSGSVDALADVDRQQGLARFRQLVAEAVTSMSPKYRDVIRLNLYEGLAGAALAERIGVSRAEIDRRVHDARGILLKVAGTLMIVDTCRQVCPRLDGYLQAAGWQDGPFDEQLRQRLMQHIPGCRVCAPARRRAMTWVEMLPVVVPVLVPERLQREIVRAIRGDRDDNDSQDDRRRRPPVATPPPVRRRRRRRRAAAAALILALLLFGVLLLPRVLVRSGEPLTAQAVSSTTRVGPISSIGGGGPDLAGRWELGRYTLIRASRRITGAAPARSGGIWIVMRQRSCARPPCRYTVRQQGFPTPPPAVMFAIKGETLELRPDQTGGLVGRTEHLLACQPGTSSGAFIGPPVPNGVRYLQTFHLRVTATEGTGATKRVARFVLELKEQSQPTAEGSRKKCTDSGSDVYRTTARRAG